MSLLFVDGRLDEGAGLRFEESDGELNARNRSDLQRLVGCHVAVHHYSQEGVLKNVFFTREPVSESDILAYEDYSGTVYHYRIRLSRYHGV